MPKKYRSPPMIIHGKVLGLAPEVNPIVAIIIPRIATRSPIVILIVSHLVV